MTQDESYHKGVVEDSTRLGSFGPLPLRPVINCKGGVEYIVGTSIWDFIPTIALISLDSCCKRILNAAGNLVVNFNRTRLVPAGRPHCD